MRIMKGRSKDPTYHVIQDVRRNGKRSTEIIENLGHASEMCEKYNVSNADEWAENYVRGLREKEEARDHRILVPFNRSVIIEADKRLSFNIVYLFLQRRLLRSVHESRR